nr:hypothetical protein CFP56_09660 [Quercus suber]
MKSNFHVVEGPCRSPDPVTRLRLILRTGDRHNHNHNTFYRSSASGRPTVPENPQFLSRLTLVRTSCCCRRPATFVTRMNNSHFRKLLGEQTPARPSHATSPTGDTTSVSSARKSIVPMTPRNVKGGVGVDFARQVRERNAASRPTKKFKSYAPKGVTLGAGYTDRAKAREEIEVADDKAERIKALEEQMKLGQISQHTFESLRDTITGGDISSTHLVKGLDRKLLERVRKGEDVLSGGAGATEAVDGSAQATPGVDDELDRIAEQEVQTVRHEEKSKKGTLALAGKKRNRDEIMAELKAQRKAAAEAEVQAQPRIELDSRWKKVGDRPKPRIEVDAKGREVLITVDEDGHVKRKVRKVTVPVAEEEQMIMAPSSEAPRVVLGADVAIPQAIVSSIEPSKQEDDDDDDIFGGVGAEYNPLGDEEEEDDNDDDHDDDDDGPSHQYTLKNTVVLKRTDSGDGARTDAGTALNHVDEQDDSVDAETPLEPTPSAKPTAASRNYFNDKSAVSPDSEPGSRFAGIQNVLKKAAQLDPLQSSDQTNDNDNDEDAARRKKRAQMLTQQDRDLADMDMGFGSSRFEDEQDGDGGSGTKVRLFEWKGGDDDGWEDGDGKGGGKKKRKPKKRKGDVNNAADIMRVIEGRRKESG